MRRPPCATATLPRSVAAANIGAARVGFGMLRTTADHAGCFHLRPRSRRARPRGVVTGLAAGQRYLFRVAGVNAVGKGPWSQTVEQLAAL